MTQSEKDELLHYVHNLHAIAARAIEDSVTKETTYHELHHAVAALAVFVRAAPVNPNKKRT